MERSNYKSLKQDKKQLVFARASLILTNYFLPLNEALAVSKASEFYYLEFVKGS